MDKLKIEKLLHAGLVSFVDHCHLREVTLAFLFLLRENVVVIRMLTLQTTLCGHFKTLGCCPPCLYFRHFIKD